MYFCNKCNKEFDLKQAKSNHEKYCDGTGIKKRKNRGSKYIKCHKCNEEVISQGFKKHYNSCIGVGVLNRIRYNGKGRGWESGKTFIEIYGDEKSKIIKNKISHSLKGKSKGKGSTEEIEQRRRQKIREKIIKRYNDGWVVKCGRAPKINYQSSIAGKIKLDGNWELEVAKYLDKNNFRWIRNKKRFLYIDENGINRSYCPDFYIDDWHSFLEIKGYETKLDKLKWIQFKNNLIIWKKKELINLGII